MTDKDRALLQPALDYTGTHDIASIERALAAGTMQIWRGEKTVLITEIVQCPLKKLCQVAFIGGELSEVMQFDDRIARWAKANGCDSVWAAGRNGWGPVMKKRGWRQVGVTLERRL